MSLILSMLKEIIKFINYPPRSRTRNGQGLVMPSVLTSISRIFSLALFQEFSADILTNYIKHSKESDF